ncbi:MAG: type I-U CRISPR-associated protein Cas8c [Candidatus Omnitrophota bacterium]
MTYPEPNIRINVDVTNPGQFFACCGLLELADRLWPGAEGWFSLSNFQFCIRLKNPTNTLQELLYECKQLSFNIDDNSNGDNDDENDNALVLPILMKWKDETDAILLDWWSDKSIKPWAGSMKHKHILRAMLDAIDPAHSDPFNDMRNVYDAQRDTVPQTDGRKQRIGKSKKREPFYFDPRRGNKSHPLDSGFSPDTHHMESDCCPVVEALCFIGFQRARPAPTDTPNRSCYSVWTTPLTANVLNPAVCGILTLPNSMTCVFENYFRTDQRKHKTFSQSKLERNSNV